MADPNYVGQNDYRGYLAYLGQNGDVNASTALGFVGNDGGIDEGNIRGYIGGANTTQAQDTAQEAALRQFVLGSYSQFQNGSGAPKALGDNTGGATTNGTTSTYDPQAQAYFDQQIGNVNSGVDRLDNQRTIGKQNVLDSYNTAYNTLLGQRQQADTAYKTNKDTTGQDNVVAKNNIASNVGYQANALQRLLGSHGSGSSSAAQFSAPYAAARLGALDRSGVDRTFAKNNQSLDQAYGDFGLNYDKSQKDLTHQLEVNNNSVDSGIDSSKASFLQQLAGLNSQKSLASGKSYAEAVGAAQPYVDQSNALLGQVDNLGKQYATPVTQGAPATYKAPSLDSYNAPTRQALTVNSNAATDTANPFSSLLFGNGKDKLTRQTGF